MAWCVCDHIVAYTFLAGCLRRATTRLQLRRSGRLSVKDPKVGMAIFRIGRRVTVGITFLALNSACPGLCLPWTLPTRRSPALAPPPWTQPVCDRHLRPLGISEAWKTRLLKVGCSIPGIPRTGTASSHSAPAVWAVCGSISHASQRQSFLHGPAACRSHKPDRRRARGTATSTTPSMMTSTKHPPDRGRPPYTLGPGTTFQNALRGESTGTGRCLRQQGRSGFRCQRGWRRPVQWHGCTAAMLAERRAGGSGFRCQRGPWQRFTNAADKYVKPEAANKPPYTSGPGTIFRDALRNPRAIPAHWLDSGTGSHRAGSRCALRSASGPRSGRSGESRSIAAPTALSKGRPVYANRQSGFGSVLAIQIIVWTPVLG